jgi:hypothetical protein
LTGQARPASPARSARPARRARKARPIGLAGPAGTVGLAGSAGLAAPAGQHWVVRRLPCLQYYHWTTLPRSLKLRQLLGP